MDNSTVSEILETTARLMELHGENPFKIKSYQSAAYKIERLKENLIGKSQDELEKLDGIGKSLSLKILQLLNDGSFPELDRLLSETPEGVQEMMRIKGIGPKKVALLWKELQIESPGELLYACNENRLVELKGFGAKTQEQIKRSIEFSISQRGLFHFATAERSALLLLKELEGLDLKFKPVISGEIRRKCEIVSSLDFIACHDDYDAILKKLRSTDEKGFSGISENEQGISLKTEEGLPVQIHFNRKGTMACLQWTITGNNEHIRQCLDLSGLTLTDLENAESESDLYARFGLPYLEPEWREGRTEIRRAREGHIPASLVDVHDLKGILHNHSTYSDGIHSLEEMAVACKELGYEYLGICDHSKSAQYAGGLSIEKVNMQQEEIRQLNSILQPFRIFSGIESDILADGSLDYPDEILAGFDFVVASVHSGLRMDKDKATQRLLTAIRNPYTTILGHPSGRLLLSREGYPLDYEKIIQACAETGVVIELNAHPYRLDLDWRWIEYALEKGVKISINPDAHSTEGYRNMYYGVCTGRKGYLTPQETFSAMGLKDIEQWFKNKKGNHTPH
ncbi:MAG: DNA polymerase/3'-5' exonuclease PolX [Bacteroidia bacterium]|nr:DNA polymerase/3'-5' exonuclease PolX [Bacteroidia bacterium]